MVTARDSELGIRRSWGHQGSTRTARHPRGKWGLMPRKALEGPQTPIRPSSAGPLPPLRLRSRSESLKNSRSAIMTIGQIMVMLGRENCALLISMLFVKNLHFYIFICVCVCVLKALSVKAQSVFANWRKRDFWPCLGFRVAAAKINY